MIWQLFPVKFGNTEGRFVGASGNLKRVSFGLGSEEGKIRLSVLLFSLQPVQFILICLNHL